MVLIKVLVNYNGTVTINGDYKTTAPVEMSWFPDNDLVIETEYETITFNTANPDTYVYAETPYPVYTVTPRQGARELTPVENVQIKLMENNVAKYLIVNDKFAYRLPNSLWQ